MGKPVRKGERLGRTIPGTKRSYLSTRALGKLQPVRLRRRVNPAISFVAYFLTRANSFPHSSFLGWWATPAKEQTIGGCTLAWCETVIIENENSPRTRAVRFLQHYLLLARLLRVLQAGKRQFTFHKCHVVSSESLHRRDTTRGGGQPCETATTCQKHLGNSTVYYDGMDLYVSRVRSGCL